jgi:hypothetical protein
MSKKTITIKIKYTPDPNISNKLKRIYDFLLKKSSGKETNKIVEVTEIKVHPIAIELARGK